MSSHGPNGIEEQTDKQTSSGGLNDRRQHRHHSSVPDYHGGEVVHVNDGLTAGMYHDTSQEGTTNQNGGHSSMQSFQYFGAAVGRAHAAPISAAESNVISPETLSENEQE